MEANMNELFSILIKYLLAFLLSGLIFGATFITETIIYRWSNMKFKGLYTFQFWGLIAFLVLHKPYPDMISVIDFEKVFRWKNLLLMIVAGLPINIYFYFKRVRTQKNQIETVRTFFDGVFMEVPQRLFMQNLFILMGLGTVIFEGFTLAVLLNALIWVLCILAQELFIGKREYKKLVPEIMTSFWFSIWIGILYTLTGNILLPMITHGLLRIFPYGVLDKVFMSNKG